MWAVQNIVKEYSVCSVSDSCCTEAWNHWEGCPAGKNLASAPTHRYILFTKAWNYLFDGARCQLYFDRLSLSLYSCLQCGGVFVLWIQQTSWVRFRKNLKLMTLKTSAHWLCTTSQERHSLSDRFTFLPSTTLHIRTLHSVIIRLLDWLVDIILWTIKHKYSRWLIRYHLNCVIITRTLHKIGMTAYFCQLKCHSACFFWHCWWVVEINLVCRKCCFHCLLHKSLVIEMPRPVYSNSEKRGGLNVFLEVLHTLFLLWKAGTLL